VCISKLFCFPDILSDPEYPHLPDVETFDGLLDLVSACSLVILGDILDVRTYSAPNQGDDEEISNVQRSLMLKYDQNNIPRNERLAIIYAQGVAFSIFNWVQSHFIVTGPDGDVDDLPSCFLVQILKTLIKCKQKAMRLQLKGAPHCNTKSLRKQVMNIVECDSCIKNRWANSDDIFDNSLAFQSKDGYFVERKVAGNAPAMDFGASVKLELLVTSLTSADPSQHLQKGMTPLDMKFWQGEAQQLASEGALDATEQEESISKKI
jgi:hypothetical protein